MNGDGITGKGQKLGRAGLTEGWGRADKYLGTEFNWVSSDRRIYYEEVPAITKHLTLEFGWHLKIIILKVVPEAMGKDVIKGKCVWTKRRESRPESWVLTLKGWKEEVIFMEIQWSAKFCSCSCCCHHTPPSMELALELLAPPLSPSAGRGHLLYLSLLSLTGMPLIAEQNCTWNSNCAGV